jgi:hypothetical protein
MDRSMGEIAFSCAVSNRCFEVTPNRVIISVYQHKPEKRCFLRGPGIEKHKGKLLYMHTRWHLTNLPTMAAGRCLNPRLLRHDGSCTRKASARSIATNKPWWVECEGVGTAAMRSGPEEQQQELCFLASNGGLGLRALGSYDSLGYWMQQTTAADAGE